MTKADLIEEVSRLAEVTRKKTLRSSSKPFSIA